MQLDFAASSPAEAFRSGPYEVDLSQHAGGERAGWSDSKLQRQGTHPVVYVATGSHANYFGRALYLGRGAREGFGCDDTRAATARLQPGTVELPDIPSSPSSPYAWLAFQGRWGQKEPGIYNGPFGPGFHEQWAQPIAWAESADHSLNFINIAAALIYTFTVPFAAIQLTLFYFDLEVREAAEAASSGAA